MTSPQKLKLTDTLVSKAEPGDLITDLEIPHLKLRVSPKGKRTFFIEFRLEGRKYKKVLGTFPGMRVATARSVYADTYQDLIHESTKKASLTVQKMINGAIEAKVKKGISENTRKLYERHGNFLITFLGPNSAAQDVTVSKCEEAHGCYPSRVQANRMMDFLRMCFNRAIDLELVTRNPASKVERNREFDRSVKADMGTLARIIEVAKETEQPHCSLFIYVLATTGTRVEQVKRMMWGDIVGDVWYKDGAHSKNREDGMIWLGKDLIDDLKQLGESPMVFGRFAHRKPWERVRVKCGVPDLRLHDLRKISGTFLLQQGEGIKQVASFLQHKGTRVTERYYAKYQSNFKDQAELLRRQLEAT